MSKQESRSLLAHDLLKLHLVGAVLPRGFLYCTIGARESRHKEGRERMEAASKEATMGAERRTPCRSTKHGAFLRAGRSS